LFPIDNVPLTFKRKRLLKKCLILIRKTTPITWHPKFEDITKILLENIHIVSINKANLINILNEFDDKQEKSHFITTTTATTG
jgi:hypothetical protein